MARLAKANVLVVGVGGVGGWCAEALARTGVGNLTIVDDDTVVESNLNRQCAATVATLGKIKVEAMRERLAAVNPDCKVTACNVRYPDASVRVADFDIVADAIDSVDCKAELILNATEAGVPLVSSMGAALRLDPTHVKTSRFDKVEGDGLARALRQRFKRLGRYPKNFTAVWSDELPSTLYPLSSTHSPRGSVMPVVAAFGMCLAAEIVKRIIEANKHSFLRYARRAWLSLALLAAGPALAANNGGFNDNIDRTDPNFVKASLLIMGKGDTLYSSAGHTSIRLECPIFKLDQCYTYESEAASDRVLAFLAGKLKMGMFAIPTDKFTELYEKEGRGVLQYELALPPDAKQRLWKLLDEKVAEGVDLQYDFIKRGCAQSTLAYLFEAVRPAPVEYAPWDVKYQKTCRELFADATSECPWNLCFLQAIGGIDVDADMPKIRRIVVPGDLLEFLRGVKVDGKPILAGEPTVLLPQTRKNGKTWFTPVMAAGLLALLAIAGIFVKLKWIDVVFLGFQSIVGLFLSYLVFGSTLPATTWNWLLIPFNPLPLVFWKWRRYWALPFSVVIVAWVAFMVFSPHQLTDWAYVVLAVGYAAWYAGIWLECNFKTLGNGHRAAKFGML